MPHGRRRRPNQLEQMSEKVTRWTGTTAALLSAAGIIVLWAAVGPLFHDSDTWQLVINTGTTIVTFHMVFLIQRSQNGPRRVVLRKMAGWPPPLRSTSPPRSTSPRSTTR